MKKEIKPISKTEAQARENINRIITSNTMSILDRYIEKRLKEEKEARA